MTQEVTIGVHLAYRQSILYYVKGVRHLQTESEGGGLPTSSAKSLIYAEQSRTRNLCQLGPKSHQSKKLNDETHSRVR